VEQPSPDFARQVRDALSHLYDTVRLQNHSLVSRLSGSYPADVVSGAQALRRTLLDTLELLRPSDHIPYRAREWRPYRVLFQRYVKRQASTAIVTELAISDRQYQREHAAGLSALTTLLWQQASQKTDGASRGISDEAQRLIDGARRAEISGRQLIQGAVSDLSRLAESRGIEIKVSFQNSADAIYGDRAVLRQILLNVTSTVLALAHHETVNIRVGAQGDELVVSVYRQGTCELQDASGDLPSRLAISRQLVSAIGGRLWTDPVGVHVSLPIRRQVLMVIDDNSDFVDMVARFLADSRVIVLGVSDTSSVIETATDVQPFLVILDVMMPSRDGWEILQSLKHAPETRELPVAICSILVEPELAESLGADDYVKKPLNQRQLLELVGKWQPTPD